NRWGWTPFDVVAGKLDERMVAWLLEHGADVAPQGNGDRTPLDLAATSREWLTPRSAERFAAIVAMLQRRGAELTARSAVALGEADWLRARHAAGALANTTVVDV